MYAVAMQTYLATADPAGLCPLVAPALRVSKEPGWQMSRAICASLSGDQGMASSFLNQAARRGVARGIDFHLAEKVVGAGFNSRRPVNIERSEERRVGKECVSTCRYRWLPYT